MKNLTILSLVVILFSCQKKEEQNASLETSKIETTDSSVIEPTPRTEKLKQGDSIKIFYNDKILDALKEKDYKKFSDFIHPKKGVRFSMYAFINQEKDKMFSKEEFEKYINSDVKFTWGEKDGSGEIYVETLRNYLQNWVSKADFANSNFTLNKFQGGGNSLNNLKEIYPNADFTENYVTGTEKYGRMDWKTLRLVFEKFEGKYYLVAVINDEWTI